MADDEEQGLTTGQDIVWVCDVDIPNEARYAIADLYAQRLLVAYPKPVVAFDGVIWRPVPRYFAEERRLDPHYDNPGGHRG